MAAVQSCKPEIVAYQIKKAQSRTLELSEEALKASSEAEAAFDNELRDYGKMWVVQSRAGKCFLLFGG